MKVYTYYIPEIQVSQPVRRRRGAVFIALVGLAFLVALLMAVEVKA